MLVGCFVISAFIALAQAQYGGNAPNYGGPSYQPPRLVDNYVCSFEANYGLYGQFNKKFRPTPNWCQDAYKEGSCERCCRMAAQIQNINVKEEDVLGFNIVLKKEPLCICCAPTNVQAYPVGYDQATPAPVATNLDTGYQQYNGGGY